MPVQLIVALLLASTLLAQDEKDDGKQAFIDLRLDTSGHGELFIKIEGAPGIEQFLTEPVRHALVRPLGCEGTKLWGQTVFSRCPGLLTLHGPNLSGTIRVDSIFQPLYDLGIDDVTVFVHIPDAAQNPATPEDAHWVQVLTEGKGLRYGHRSGPRHHLPPSLQIEYPARHHAQAGQVEMRSTLISVCGIIFLPALFAAWLSYRASQALNADAEAAIGEESLWVEMLTHFIGLFWLGLLSAYELQDVAQAQFPGQPLWGALFAIALIILPPLLGSINCYGVWFPVLERAGLSGGLSFSQTLILRISSQALLLMPAALFSIASDLFPRPFGSIAGALIAGLVALVLSLCGRQSVFSGAVQLQDGELFHRAHQLAQRAGAKLRRFWILAEHTPPNAYAMSGKQIAISPAFLRQLPKAQVDAILAHELGHIRHNDFKNPTLVYIAYLAVIAPWFRNLIAGLVDPAWALLPQSVIFMLLMGLLSRHAEYRADRLAAELTTPEDAIRALCRIHRQNRMPLSLHPFSEALVSHPSLIHRARAIAHDHQQSSEWLRRIMLDEWDHRPTPIDSYTATEEALAPPALVASN